MSRHLLVLVFLFQGILSPCVLAKTKSNEVSALNNMYTSLNSPSKLKGWKSSGGDPCGDSWEGVKCKGSSVTELQLSDLDLSGSLGYQLGNLKSVTKFDMSKNNLNGNIPYQLPPNVQQLDLSENNLNGNVPYSISQMENLRNLNLARNQLNGEVSDMFQKLSKLQTMDLSNNQLSGKLPQSFMNLTSLKTLYLQENQFMGSINVLRELPLDDLNVENNKFSGWIPNELKGIDNLDTAGNDWSSSAAPPPPPGVTYRRKSSSSDGEGRGKSLVYGLVIAGSGLGVLALIAVFIALLSRRKSNPSSQFIEEGGSQGSRRFTSLPSNDLANELRIDLCDHYEGRKSGDSNASFGPIGLKRSSSNVLKHVASSRKVSFNDREFESRLKASRSTSLRALEFPLADLQTMTANFAPGRLLGEGSVGRVYRAKDSDGRVLAVKKIDSSLFESRTSEEFSSVVKNAMRIHHPNIAELVGHCSERGHHLLVYEYFRNGSLYDFLHLSDDFSKPLTWNTRVRISLGTARAIEYLHDVCFPPVVHNSIKSSNILLDTELNPKLSEHGLGNLYARASQSHRAGYKAPECKSPSGYTPKSDAYSFGVVMLELLTGRMPYDSNRAKPDQSLARWAAPQLHDVDALTKMVDPALRGLYPPKSVSQFADIIALCIQSEPEFRPSMSEVVESLVRLVQRSSAQLKADLSSSTRTEDSVS